MRSNDEEYLDSLLNSAQSNKIKPDSALGRMSSKVRANSETLASDDGEAGGISELVNNSGGNENLNEIGDLLRKLDRDEILDEGMAQMLDDIARPTDSAIPKFTVGNSPTSEDTRDPEEIALDEAIADAERLEAEIQNGKFNDANPYDEKSSSIVDIEEGDDALLEMAPEIVMPDESIADIAPEITSDADESPEEILNGLLDEEQEGNLSLSDENVSGESLSDALDSIQEETDPFEVPDSAVVADILGNSDEGEAPKEEMEPMDDLESMLDSPTEEPEMAEAPVDAEMPEMAGMEEIPAEPEIPEISESHEMAEEPAAEAPAEQSDDINIDDMSMSDLEAEMQSLMGEDVAPAESIPDDIDLGGFTFDGGDGTITDEASEEGSAEGGKGGEAAPEGDLSLEDLMADSMDTEGAEPAGEEAAAEAPKASSDSDEFNLDDMEASLDNLLGGEAGDLDSIEGEVAELAELGEGGEGALEAGGEGGQDVSMPDLDALMNSLANDEIEDIESTAQQDKEAGVAEEEELPKEDILDALTEDVFSDQEEGGGEPSLEDLAAIPERKASSGGEEEAEEGKKKGGLFGLIAKFFNALTEEEPEGTEGLASLTDENQTVLNELAKDEKPKKEKKKKEKKPKEKKPAKPKKPKEKKPPKPKKEKKPKEPKEPGAPEKVISPKKIALSGLFAASIGILVFIPSLILPDRIANERANSAYEREEYATAYKMLYGKKMTEEQEVVYEQSRVLAWSERYLTGYQNYVEMGMKEEALDMLLMGMRNKADLLEEAQKFNVEIQVQTVYDSIESVLADKYSLSVEDIDEINSIRKDREYTIRLMEIVGTL